MLTPAERLYFAYGSNMCRSQMATRCPAARVHGVATIEGWRFAINTLGWATLLPEPGSLVRGVVWTLTPGCEATLDICEEVDLGVYRKEMIALPEHHDALIYLATDTTLGHPRPAYIDRVVTAAAAAGFPSPYVAELAGWRSQQPLVTPPRPA